MSRENEPTEGRTQEFTFRVFRYQPDAGPAPRFDTFKLAVAPGTTVLAALLRIQRECDPSLAFRFSCRGAVCGACAITINGRCGLACRTQLSSLGGGDVVLEPLPHLDVIRDLVVDMTPFWEKYRRVQPWLHAAMSGADKRPAPPVRENPQSPAEFHRIEQYVNCILCACCYGACKVLARQDGYLGPAALARLLRFVEDSRDHRDPAVLLALGNEEKGIWGCDTLFRCIDACPKDVRPADAIAGLRRRSILNRLRGKHET